MATVAPSAAISVADDTSLNRYELRVDGVLAAAATYLLVPGGIVFNYTELMRGFEGRGLGGHLAGAALDDVRRRGLRVAPRCPFISTFIEDHPDYADLLDSRFVDPVSA
jgi:hypothetical protein